MWKTEEHKPIQIDVSLIPKEDVQNLCRTFITAIKEYYADTKNVEAFEQWQKEREARKA